MRPEEKQQYSSTHGKDRNPGKDAPHWPKQLLGNHLYETAPCMDFVGQRDNQNFKTLQWLDSVPPGAPCEFTI